MLLTIIIMSVWQKWQHSRVISKKTNSHLCGSTVAVHDIGVDTTQVVAPGRGRSRHLPQIWVPGRPAPRGGTGRRAGRAAQGWQATRQAPKRGRRSAAVVEMSVCPWIEAMMLLLSPSQLRLPPSHLPCCLRWLATSKPLARPHCYSAPIGRYRSDRHSQQRSRQSARVGTSTQERRGGWSERSKSESVRGEGRMWGPGEGSLIYSLQTETHHQRRWEGPGLSRTWVCRIHPTVGLYQVLQNSETETVRVQKWWKEPTWPGMDLSRSPLLVCWCAGLKARSPFSLFLSHAVRRRRAGWAVFQVKLQVWGDLLVGKWVAHGGHQHTVDHGLLVKSWPCSRHHLDCQE